MRGPKQRIKIVIDWLKANNLFDEYKEAVESKGSTVEKSLLFALRSIRPYVMPDFYAVFAYDLDVLDYKRWGMDDSEKVLKPGKVYAAWKKYLDDIDIYRIL